MPVKNIISFVISLSSLFAKIKEIIGDVLSKVQPIPIGRVLKTICWINNLVMALINLKTNIW